jgi:hypothetical protein
VKGRAGGDRLKSALENLETGTMDKECTDQRKKRELKRVAHGFLQLCVAAVE